MVLNVWDYKEQLRVILKKYSKIDDIILFGKALKGVESKNVDALEIAIILKEQDDDLKQILELNLGEKILLTILSKEEIYSNKNSLLIFLEGFSIKFDKLVRELLGVHPRKLYSYTINHLSNTEKRAFNRQLLRVSKRIDARKLGSGTILIPLESSSFFEDFLRIFNITHESEVFTVL